MWSQNRKVMWKGRRSRMRSFDRLLFGGLSTWSIGQRRSANADPSTVVLTYMSRGTFGPAKIRVG